MIHPWATQRLKRLEHKIKKNWDKLTNDEIALFKENPDAFYDIVKGKYGMVREDVERRVKQLSQSYIL